jgi:hypothetical protein
MKLKDTKYTISINNAGGHASWVPDEVNNLAKTANLPAATDPVTLDIWVKLSGIAMADSKEERLLAHWHNVFLFMIGDKLGVRAHSIHTTGDVTIPMDKWTRISASFSTGGATPIIVLYKNGAFADRLKLDAPLVEHLLPFSLGLQDPSDTKQQFDGPITGEVARVLIWNTAITQPALLASQYEVEPQNEVNLIGAYVASPPSNFAVDKATGKALFAPNTDTISPTGSHMGETQRLMALAAKTNNKNRLHQIEKNRVIKQQAEQSKHEHISVAYTHAANKVSMASIDGLFFISDGVICRTDHSSEIVKLSHLKNSVEDSQAIGFGALAINEVQNCIYASTITGPSAVWRFPMTQDGKSLGAGLMIIGPAVGFILAMALNNRTQCLSTLYDSGLFTVVNVSDTNDAMNMPVRSSLQIDIPADPDSWEILLNEGTEQTPGGVMFSNSVGHWYLPNPGTVMKFIPGMCQTDSIAYYPSSAENPDDANSNRILGLDNVNGVLRKFESDGTSIPLHALEPNARNLVLEPYVKQLFWTQDCVCASAIAQWTADNCSSVDETSTQPIPNDMGDAYALVNHSTSIAPLKTPFPGGEFSRGFSFNGQSSFLELRDATALNKLQFSASMWFCPDSDSSTGPQTLVWLRGVELDTKQSPPSEHLTDVYYLQRIPEAKVWQFNYVLAHQETAVGVNLPLKETGWTHIVFTYNGETLKIYFDGECRSSKTIQFSRKPGYRLRIGNGEGGYHFKGQIAQISYWDRVVCEMEIKTQFKLVRQRMLMRASLDGSGKPQMLFSMPHARSMAIRSKEIAQHEELLKHKHNLALKAAKRKVLLQKKHQQSDTRIKAAHSDYQTKHAAAEKIIVDAKTAAIAKRAQKNSELQAAKDAAAAKRATAKTAAAQAKAEATAQAQSKLDVANQNAKKMKTDAQGDLDKARREQNK